MSDTYFDTWPNRTVCDILSEIRTCHKTHNYSYLSGLLEELQSYANRMEAALSDKKDIRNWTEMRHTLKEEIKLLRKQKKELTPAEPMPSPKFDSPSI